MELHFKNWHKLDSQMRPLQVPMEQLPFDPLPPGTWGLIDHHQRGLHNSPARPNDREDLSRLEKIVSSFRVVKRWEGKKSWRGYYVFELENSNSVVLECPKEGNATYILFGERIGEWKEMIHYSKAEIRQEYVNRHKKVVHKGDWLGRIRLALSGPD